ncbi:MAG: hypothetical protein HY821_00545 [Acidobacteria bacterium]|nr:hypothetical protein [Acidobacteriota bacterium]
MRLFVERIEALGALRAFAHYGILGANWRGFGWPAEFYGTPSAVLRAIAVLRMQMGGDLLFDNKFITLLSLHLVWLRDSDGPPARPALRGFFAHRLPSLTVIGAFHAFLIWWGTSC